MKQNPQGRQQPSKPTSTEKTPLWLTTSLILGFTSVVSLLYYFFFRRSRVESQPEEKPSIRPQSLEKVPEYPQEAVKNNPVYTAVEVKPLKKPPHSQPALDRPRLITGLLTALVLAYIAQGIFDPTHGIFKDWIWLAVQPESTRLWIGAGLYLVSMALWALVMPPLRSAVTSPDLPAAPDGNKLRGLHYSLLIACAGLYFAPILLFVSTGETPLIRSLWAASLAVFILSTFLLPNAHRSVEESPRFRWYNWILLALILGGAFWLRFYHLSTIPDDFHGDMAEHGWIARNYLLEREENIFGYGFYGIPALGFLPAAFSLTVFGNNLFGLYMTAVMAGMLNLLAVYLLIWRLFDNHQLAALTTALTATAVAHIHFSRIVENMDPWGFGVLGLFFLVDGLKSHRFRSFGLAGILLGLGVEMYFSGRALAFIVAFFLLYALFFRRNWVVQNWKGLLWMIAGVFFAVGPALAAHLIHWDDYIGRTRGVFIFSPEALNHLFFGYHTDSRLTVLLIQIKRSLLMFNYFPDTSGQFRYPYPMFSSLVSPLIALGFGFSLRRWKDAGLAFILIWLCLLLTLGGILTIDTPFTPRLVGLIPAAAFLAALVLEQLLEVVERISGATAVRPFSVFISIFMIVVGWRNWNEYHSIMRDNGTPPTIAGRFISQLPMDITACGIFNEFRFDDHATVTFMVWPRKIVYIPADAPDSALEECGDSPLVWAISPENTSRLDAIRSRWPQGILHTETRQDYTVTFYLVGLELPKASSGIFTGK